MYTCVNCKGVGYQDDHTECPICLGNGRLVLLMGLCNQCRGKGCVACGMKGTRPDPRPFTTPSEMISTAELREALTLSRIGYDTDENPSIPYAEGEKKVDSKLLGVLAGLLEISRERDGESTTPGTWLKMTLLDADGVVIESSGIWLMKKDIGIRVYEFPLSTV